jgi:salicylate hydroxylase
MTDKGFHVGIVGGGIGGLALAQGLKKAGMSAAVYERDRTPTDRLQGYRVHISPKGSEALHSCLPAELFEVFAATCSVGNRGFRFLTEKMEELLSIEIRSDARSIAQHRSASRITLRQVLLSGLDGILRFGKTFMHYEEMADGPIVLHFTDGSTATCDVLVGADGGNSRVRHQFLPHAQRIDTGAVGIAAKAMLTEENRRRLPPRVLAGTGMVMSPGRRGMFIGLHEFAEDAPAPQPGRRSHLPARCWTTPRATCSGPMAAFARTSNAGGRSNNSTRPICSGWCSIAFATGIPTTACWSALQIHRPSMSWASRRRSRWLRGSRGGSR